MKNDASNEIYKFIFVLLLGFEILGYFIIIISFIDVVKYFLFDIHFKIIWSREIIGCIIAFLFILLSRLIRRRYYKMGKKRK